MYTVLQVTEKNIDNFNTFRVLWDFDEEEMQLIRDNFNYYEEVAKFDVDSLWNVYRASNEPFNRDFWESKTDRMQEMHSVSKGDIVKDPEGNLWVLGKDDFQKIN